MIAIFTGMAIAPQLFFTESLDPQFCNLADTTQTPSAEHWFGTDILGCDYYTRVVYGTRTSMEVGLIVAGATLLIALTLGGAAGYFGGATDMVISRIADVCFCVPTILGSILLLSLFNGGGVLIVALVLVFFGWPDMTRLVRSTVIGGKRRGYVRAAETIGSSGRPDPPPARVAQRHRAGARVYGLHRGRRGRRRGRADLPRGRRPVARDLVGTSDRGGAHAIHERAVPLVLPVVVPLPVHRGLRPARRVDPRRARREAGRRMSDPLLAVDDLQVEFRTEEGVVNAVDGVTYMIGRGEVLAILGESGSGKTVHARAIMRILDSPPAHITGGSAKLRDIDVLTLDEADMREIRGAKIAMLFQDPHTALDPVFTVGDQMVELLRTRKGISKREARETSIQLLDRVGIASPEERHEGLST